MQSDTYKDIIDDKIAEWQNSLKKLEEQTGAARSDTKKDKLRAKTNQLRSAIDKAIVQLRDLDEQETVANTMETKDQIVKIFTSIDKDFIGNEESSPYML
jgi:hypothetical protein